MKFSDQIGRCLNLESVPKRIVSLVPSQTELLYDLGLEKNIVGITKFCIHPTHLRKEKTIVGGTKSIHIDKIKDLQPDIILCNKEENTKEIVAICEPICTVHVSDIYTVEDSLELIYQYGELFHRTLEAKGIINTVNDELINFKVFIEQKPLLKTVYFIWKDPWLVAANHTFINHLLRLNKFENIYVGLERYPEIELKASNLNNSVDLVLLSSEPYPFKEKHKEYLEQYYPNTQITLADGEMFSWYGSRLTKAFQYFKTLRLSF